MRFHSFYSVWYARQTGREWIRVWTIRFLHNICDWLSNLWCYKFLDVDDDNYSSENSEDPYATDGSEDEYIPPSPYQSSSGESVSNKKVDVVELPEFIVLFSFLYYDYNVSIGCPVNHCRRLSTRFRFRCTYTQIACYKFNFTDNCT